MEKRKHSRFAMQLPLEVTRAGGQRISTSGFTRNIGGGGVLFTAEPRPPLGGRIEYVIALPSAAHDVSIRCVGRVLRTAPEGVAATLERYEFFRPG